ncbi:MAG: Unknown protein [uncultured Thiotrichaceae bacterium]|uniref:Response regulatory domain-containing protein n=1 Tax=uncultured Thiotrichaceae bacterium TaxID=298394 RepID=A0A6S6SB89_9GAMM|nr:MAG: Unknown protein [uncultured Thiotrichaceae bacterium]
MPEVDEYQATQHIRQNEQYTSPPIIAMSAHASKEAQERSLQSGMSKHLTNPIVCERLIETLEQWGVSFYRCLGSYNDLLLFNFLL